MKNLLLLLFVIITVLGYSQDPIQKKSYQTQKTTNGPIIIDGVMDDESWNLVEWEGDFIQQMPYEGKQPSQPTYFKILYDDDNLYVGVLNYDSVPAEIDRRMCRRDDFEGDFIEINIDSYNDQMTAFSFTLNAAGVRGDEAITEDGENWDDTWDPIWYGKTSMVDSGWVAEIKIPFTQLRFGKKANHSWGMQFTRRIYRKEERSLWQFIPREANGWVHHFGTLEGINNISPKRQIDLFPYAVAKQEYLEKEEGNPYATGKKSVLSVGVDGKVGITNDLTLDFTINPDFGQVEADPSEVNLTAFESYFTEKRPFFIEGNNILNFPISGGGNSMALDNLFYSRRIGRMPHYYPDLIEGEEYADFPENTTILGAFKLTGKTKNGWSIGVMESITPRENAEIDLKGEKRKEEVEPFTNYFVGRVQKDINKGNTVIGGIFTSTNRKITNGEIDFLPKSAYTGGVDFTQFWKNKAYYIRLKAVVSKVNADSLAMTNIQRSSVHYFQRPDADYIHVDSSRTSLTGQGGTVEFGKAGEGHIRYVAWVTWRSPGLELNDVGFLRSGDEVFQVFWMQYGIWEPFSIFREMRINYNQWTTWDFGGRNNSFGTNVNMNMDFKNHWSFNCGVNYNGEYLSKSFLRGGPSMKKPADWNTWGWLGTDGRKKIRLSFNYSINKNFHNAGEFNFYNANVTYRPNDAIKITAGPFYSDITPTLQYVTTLDYDNNDKYIIGRMHQSTFGLSMRLEYYITPDLSVQYYGQPFISAGDYSEFKKVTDPVADEFHDRYHQFTDDEISYDEESNTYNIDENHDQKTDYSFSNPNFNFMQFRSNLVVRWEYLPGSTAYFVWSQGRTMSNDVGEFSFNNDMDKLFDVQPHNIFLIKISYRLQL
jgi:hypothetical protein